MKDITKQHKKLGTKNWELEYLSSSALVLRQQLHGVGCWHDQS